MIAEQQGNCVPTEGRNPRGHAPVSEGHALRAFAQALFGDDPDGLNTIDALDGVRR